jgi:thiol-disulfide isomerase/thioredoxin
MKTLFLSRLLVCLVCTAAFAEEEASSEPKQEEVKNLTEKGKKAPVFSITDTDRSEFKLEDHKGKVVVLYFWATWCQHCRDEMPHLESEIWQKNRSSSDFAMLGIAWK